MSYIIDRRPNSKDKSAVNRERFLRRYRQNIKQAVSDAVSRRSIKDMDQGEQVSIPRKDIQEPRFAHGRGGKRDIVMPGNEEFVVGDTIPRPQGAGGQGPGSGDASNRGEGVDDFVFEISQDEFLDCMFEDLALPNLVKLQLTGSDSFKSERAGIGDVGNPTQINILRTMRSAHARRIALAAVLRKRCARLESELAELDEQGDAARRMELEEAIASLKRRTNAIPFIDDFDLKYNLHIQRPQPVNKAVMFCLMDVSGSMDRLTKDLAKRFFVLLYLFLERNYDRTELVFIRHHTVAEEVDEQTFFYSRETGGTVVSSALELMHRIIADRFSPSEWNIYGAQASDGDNWPDDSPRCIDMLARRILPITQYFCYVEIAKRDSRDLWNHYQRLSEPFSDSFAMRKISDQSDIFPVFKELFQRREHR